MAEEEVNPPQTSQALNVDLEELARLIFELLKRELLIENERTGR